MAEGYEPNPNGEKISESVSVNSTYGTSSLTVYRTGNVVQMVGTITITTAVPSYTNFMTLPSGFGGYSQSFYAHQGNNIYWLFGINGFSPQGYTLATGQYYFNETWIVN